MARILLIEDDDELRRVLSASFRRGGHDVVEASSGQGFLRLVEEHHPDAIVTDINMPDADGIEVFTALHDRPNAPPVIAISGGGLIPKGHLLDSARLLGATEILEKPFEMQELLDALDRATGRASQLPPRRWPEER